MTTLISDVQIFSGKKKEKLDNFSCGRILPRDCLHSLHTNKTMGYYVRFKQYLLAKSLR